MERITRAQAEEILRGHAIIPGCEEIILKSMGYEIAESKLKLNKLQNHRESSESWYTLDGLAECETENYLVAAGSMMHRYMDGPYSGIGKDRLLLLEFARKDLPEKVKTLELAKVRVTTPTSTRFDEYACGITGAKLEILGNDTVRAIYPHYTGTVTRSYDISLNEKYIVE